MSEYKYVYGQGRTALNVPESDIRYAMENTKSNAAAARFLKISFTSYKKYARMYTDRDTGKTLYELHKNLAVSNPCLSLPCFTFLELFIGINPVAFG